MDMDILPSESMELAKNMTVSTSTIAAPGTRSTRLHSLHLHVNKNFWTCTRNSTVYHYSKDSGDLIRKVNKKKKPKLKPVTWTEKMTSNQSHIRFAAKGFTSTNIIDQCIEELFGVNCAVCITLTPSNLFNSFLREPTNDKLEDDLSFRNDRFKLDVTEKPSLTDRFKKARKMQFCFTNSGRKILTNFWMVEFPTICELNDKTYQLAVWLLREQIRYCREYHCIRVFVFHPMDQSEFSRKLAISLYNRIAFEGQLFLKFNFGKNEICYLDWLKSIKDSLNGAKRLIPTLNLRKVLPSKEVINKWKSQGVGCVYISTDLFVKDFFGYPILLEDHLNVVIEFMKQRALVVIEKGLRAITHPIEEHKYFIESKYKEEIRRLAHY